MFKNRFTEEGEAQIRLLEEHAAKDVQKLDAKEAHEDEEENKNDDDNDDESEITGVLWTVLKQNFAINPFLVENVQQFLLKHRATIAVENALGQCSTGHSCKGKAREKLQQIIKSSHNNNHAKFDDTTNATTII